MADKPTPYDFIIALDLNAIVTPIDIEHHCGVDNSVAKIALSKAFCANHLKPMQRRCKSGEDWRFHLLAISRLNNSSSDFEIAFKRI